MSDDAFLAQEGRPVKRPGGVRAAGPAGLGLAMALLAAHAWYRGEPGLAAGLLALCLPAVRGWRPMPYVLGPVLLLGGLVLAAVGRDLLLFRLAAGLPWLRLTAILGTAVALCLAGGLYALSARAKVHWQRGPDHGPAMAASFWIAVALLALARAKAPVPILLADRFFPGWGGLEIAGLGLYAAWLTGRLVSAPRTGPLRLRYWGLFSVVFFTQLFAGLAGVGACLMTGALHLPVPAVMLAGPIYRGTGYFMPILFGATALLVGPGWCAHLCYIGALDGALAGLGRTVPRPLPARLTGWRLASLAATVGLAAGFRSLGLDTAVAVWTAAGFGLAGLFVMIVFSRRTGVMVHCTMVCPMGLVGNWLGKLSPWRLVVGPDCDGCGRCSRVCRSLALTPSDLARGRPGNSCTLCGDCLGSCPGGRLCLRFPGLCAATARQAYFCLVVALHAVFLGVARM